MSKTSDRLNLERDLVQTRLLCAIFSRSVKNQIVLKGGLAMRLLFGSQRYTKDIDLGQNPDQSLRSLPECAKAPSFRAGMNSADGYAVP